MIFFPARRFGLRGGLRSAKTGAHQVSARFGEVALQAGTRHAMLSVFVCFTLTVAIKVAGAREPCQPGWTAGLFPEAAAALDGSAFCFAEFDDGSGPALYIGGEFVSANGRTMPRIARWDGHAMTAVGGGIGPGLSDEAYIRDMVVFDDGSGPALFVAGRFGIAGGEEIYNLAKWDGQAWAGLGLTLDNSTVLALAVYDDGSGPALYTGGWFNQIGGTSASSVAKWDGANWSPLGAGLDPGGWPAGRVYDMTVFDDGDGPNLVVAGTFRTAGTVSARGIAAWDGEDWHQVGDEFTYPGDPGIFALMAVRENGTPMLWAGGGFVGVGGETARRVANWDGTAWQPAGEGFSSLVYTLATDDPDDPALIYAGGILGGTHTSHPRIAVWDGADWAFVGGSTEGRVEAMAFFDQGAGPELFVGGSFERFDDVPVPGVGIWHSSGWSRLGNGLSAPVSDFAVIDGRSRFSLRWADSRQSATRL
jgi:hypothetical protein